MMMIYIFLWNEGREPVCYIPSLASRVTFLKDAGQGEPVSYLLPSSLVLTLLLSVAKNTLTFLFLFSHIHLSVARRKRRTSYLCVFFVLLYYHYYGAWNKNTFLMLFIVLSYSFFYGTQENRELVFYLHITVRPYFFFLWYVSRGGNFSLFPFIALLCHIFIMIVGIRESG